MQIFFLLVIFYNTLNINLGYLLFEEDEVRHVRQAYDGEKQQCLEDTLMHFLADIGIIVPEDIIHLGFETKVQMCRKIETKLQQVNDYFSSCKPPPENDLFMSLIRGVKKLFVKLCSGDPFGKRWEKYAPCLSELASDLRSCNGPGDWNEEDRDDICKVFKGIKDCNYVKSTRVCGKNAAQTLEEILVEVLNTAINVRCPKVSHPRVRDAMPETYVNQANKMNAHYGFIIITSIMVCFIER